MYYLLMYDLVPDYLERRTAYRLAHFELAKAAVARGELCLGGALAEPAESALLLFQGDSPAAAERFAKEDPYVLNGIVTQWQIRPWTVVVGAGVAAIEPPL